jgi:hypothetical protein
LPAFCGDAWRQVSPASTRCRWLAGVLQSGAAGPGVLPKGAVFIDTAGADTGHILGAVQTPNGLRLIDWQSRVFNTDQVKKLFINPLNPGDPARTIWFYPVE